MAQNFDVFPLYDYITKDKKQISDVWRDFMSTFYNNLIGYLSQNGIFLPVLTTSQRGQIQSPVNGQMIYNSTVQAPQIFQNGAWKTFTTT